MYFNRRAFLHNCTFTEVKKYIYKKYFNFQYTLTSKKENMLTTYHQLKSFPRKKTFCSFHFMRTKIHGEMF